MILSIYFFEDRQMSLFSAFNRNEKEKNLSYIKSLLQVAESDGKVDQCELDLIISIAGKFEITEDEVREILQNPDQIEFTPPSSQKAKEELIEDLVKIILADRKIEAQEKEICGRLASKLNIDPQLIDSLIADILQRDSQ